MPQDCHLIQAQRRRAAPRSAYTPEQFSMTDGVNVPFDLALMEALYDALPRRLGETRLTDLIDDRRFTETIYRVALADGIMDRVNFQDLPEDAS
jgi:hypothetical protein